MSSQDYKLSDRVTGRILLRSPNDWVLWIESIKDLAETHKLWPYLDPDAKHRPVLVEPERPDPRDFIPRTVELPALPDDMDVAPEARRQAQLARLTQNEALAKLSGDSMRAFNAAMSCDNIDHKVYLEKWRSLTTISGHILNTAIAYSSVLEGVRGPAERLQVLKRHVAPSKFAQKMDIRCEYESVRSQVSATKMEEWLRKWVNALSRAQSINLPEVQDTWPLRHFLDAIEKIDPFFCDRWRERLDDTLRKHTFEEAATLLPDGFKIAKHFREAQRLKSDMTTADLTSGSTTSNETIQGKLPSFKSSPCILGHRGHTTEKCFILNPALRKKGFKIRPKSARLILDVLEKSPEYAKKYADVIAECRAIKAADSKPAESKTPEPSQKENGTLSVSSIGCGPVCFATASDYSLRDSIILDVSSPFHITNNRSRLSNFRECTPQRILVGDTETYITGYGSMNVNATTPKGPEVLLLREVAYIEGFHTSLVSHRKIRASGYYWDDVSNAIKKDGKVVFQLFDRFGQYVLEDNEISDNAAPSTTPSPEADALIWHPRLGHAEPKVIGKFLTKKYGREVPTPSFSCETCLKLKGT